MSLNRRTLFVRAGAVALLATGAAAPRARAQTEAFNATIPLTGDGPINLRALADAAGFNGAQDATIAFELGSDVTIVGSPGAPDGGPAIDTGEWPSASHAIALSLVVDGKAYGGGGGGARGAGYETSSAGSGGDAITC